MKSMKVSPVEYEMARMLKKKLSVRNPDDVVARLIEERYKKENL